MYALTRARTSSLVRSGVRYGHNHPIFEHHENWGQNKWKPALFVSTFVGIGLFVPWFGISFAQWKSRQ